MFLILACCMMTGCSGPCFNTPLSTPTSGSLTPNDWARQWDFDPRNFYNWDKYIGEGPGKIPEDLEGAYTLCQSKIGSRSNDVLWRIYQSQGYLSLDDLKSADIREACKKVSVQFKKAVDAILAIEDAARDAERQAQEKRDVELINRVLNAGAPTPDEGPVTINLR